MDDTQLHRLYLQETQHHDNPPSFQTWLRCYLAEQRAIAVNLPHLSEVAKRIDKEPKP